MPKCVLRGESVDEGSNNLLGSLLCFPLRHYRISNHAPGRQLYNLLSVPDSNYAVLGIGATTLVIAVFNGLTYGLVVRIIYTVAERTQKRETKTQ